MEELDIGIRKNLAMIEFAITNIENETNDKVLLKYVKDIDKLNYVLSKYIDEHYERMDEDDEWDISKEINDNLKKIL